MYFVLALALFEKSSYRAVWGKLTAGLDGPTGVCPHTSSLRGPDAGWVASRCAACSRSSPARWPTGRRPAPSTGAYGWSQWTAPR
ncbi:MULTISPECIES: transposase domain-containing protein [Streptomyces]